MVGVTLLGPPPKAPARSSPLRMVVASMVVFEDGLARKGEYRRFVIKGVDGQNDVASMDEVITRRFRRPIAGRRNARAAEFLRAR